MQPPLSQVTIAVLPEALIAARQSREKSANSFLFTFYISPLTSHLLPLTSYLSPLTSYILPRTSYLLPLTSYLLPLTSHLSPLTVIPIPPLVPSHVHHEHSCS